jgi:hypothetical protein
MNKNNYILFGGLTGCIFGLIFLALFFPGNISLFLLIKQESGWSFKPLTGTWLYDAILFWPLLFTVIGILIGFTLQINRKK